MTQHSSPTFSVLLPTYNRRDRVGRAIQSVLRQTFEDFELLVVDDGSPDDTAEVVARFDDRRVRYLKRPRNGGVGATRNDGLRAARGRFVSMLDDDDEYLPSFLDRTNAVLRDAPESVGFCWSGISWIKDLPGGVEQHLRSEVWRPEFRTRDEAYRAFLINRRIGTNCGLTVRRSVLAEVGGFDEALRGGAEDTDLLIRLVQHYDFRVVNEPLVRGHLHDGPTLRRVSDAKARDYEQIMAKHEGALCDREIASALHYKTGWLYYHAGERRLGRNHMLRAIRRRPLRLKPWIALVLFETAGPAGTRLHRWISSKTRGRTGLSS